MIHPIEGGNEEKKKICEWCCWILNPTQYVCTNITSFTIQKFPSLFFEVGASFYGFLLLFYHGMNNDEVSLKCLNHTTNYLMRVIVIRHAMQSGFPSFIVFFSNWLPMDDKVVVVREVNAQSINLFFPLGSFTLSVSSNPKRGGIEEVNA